MDVNHLRLFVAVAEELHFGRAAERLQMAQPPVTRGIQSLERELRVKLFDRSTRTVTLTPVGEALLEPVYEILSAVRRVDEVVKSFTHGSAGHVKLTYLGASSYRYVGLLAREVGRLHPEIELELHGQTFAQSALRSVIRGTMDLALGRWDAIPPEVRTRLIAREDLVMAMPAHHRLADSASLSMADLADGQFIRLPPEEKTILNDRLFRLAEQAGFEPRIVQTAPDTSTATALVASDVGCFLTLSSVVDQVGDPRIRFLPVADQTLPVELRLAWRADNDSPALRTVLALAHDVWPKATA